MENYTDVTTDPRLDPNLKKYVVLQKPVLGQSEALFLGPDPSGFLVHMPDPDAGVRMIIVLVAHSNIAGLYAKTSNIAIATVPLVLPTNGHKNNGR